MYVYPAFTIYLCIPIPHMLAGWFTIVSVTLAECSKVTDAAAVLAAGAKETTYLTHYGQPLHPFQRLRRESYKYQKISPSEHVQSLEKYLQAVPYTIPNGDSTTTITHPTLRHPDLNPNNIFVSSNLSIAGAIDWQYCTILPLFLHCGILHSLQNYGDSTSETLILPSLPPDFDELNENEQYAKVELLRRGHGETQPNPRRRSDQRLKHIAP